MRRDTCRPGRLPGGLQALPHRLVLLCRKAQIVARSDRLSQITAVVRMPAKKTSIRCLSPSPAIQ